MAPPLIHPWGGKLKCVPIHIKNVMIVLQLLAVGISHLSGKDKVKNWSSLAGFSPEINSIVLLHNHFEHSLVNSDSSTRSCFHKCLLSLSGNDKRLGEHEEPGGTCTICL